jgi:hypothetical protein
MFALRDFRYKDLETGGVVEVKRGEPVSERVLNMHRDGGAALIRTKFVAGNEVAANAVTAPVLKRKRGRPKKSV